MDDVLTIYTVYNKLSDYPSKFVVRRSFVMRGGETSVDPNLFMCVRYYEDIELTMLLLGLVKLDRSPYDDPVIKETWL